MASSAGNFTRRWVDFRHGSREAAEELIQNFYPQLHRMASGQLKRERPGHTWQPTALLNELYLELIKIKAIEARPNAIAQGAAVSGATGTVHGEQAFLAFAGYVMKRLLILHARPLYRQANHVNADETDLCGVLPQDMDAAQDVESAFEGLSAIDPELRRLVELRVFEGLTMPDVARRLGCSERTAARRWDFAKHWLREFFAP